jgi:hypothetical protein
MVFFQIYNAKFEYQWSSASNNGRSWWNDQSRGRRRWFTWLWWICQFDSETLKYNPYWIHTYLLSGIYITKIITLKNPKALYQNITIKLLKETNKVVQKFVVAPIHESWNILFIDIIMEKYSARTLMIVSIEIPHALHNVKV